MDDVQFPERMLHGQWSSLALGKVGGKTLIFFGGGDGRCYAFEAPGPAADKPVILKKVWSVDCNPPEYQEAARTMPLITHYCLGDKRRSDGLNKKSDGTFVGMSEIIATPVFYKNRVYVAIGRDPAHGRGRGALWCIDATQTGDITQTGKVWCYQGLDRSLSTVSIADGLLYVSDVAGRLHCLDAETGNCYWVHEANSQTWGSTLVADGKVYMPTEKGFWVLAAGKEMKPIGKINLGAPVWASPVAANGVLYVASTRYLWAVQKKGEANMTSFRVAVVILALASLAPAAEKPAANRS
jgi:outer membrane protein assembly factor BamB